jgi:hypothetical protein
MKTVAKMAVRAALERGASSPENAERRRSVFDLKALVKELAESLDAIFEPAEGGFAIEVPLPGERFQSVTLTAAGAKLELATHVSELDASAQGTLDRMKKRARHATISLEREDAGDAWRAVIRASVPLAGATRAVVEPLLVEVGTLGDAIESELTGGDVD